MPATARAAAEAGAGIDSRNKAANGRPGIDRPRFDKRPGLERQRRFYDAVLGVIGLVRLVVKADTIGFGKTYPEFWLNARPGSAPAADNSGTHICLRAETTDAVDAFYKAAIGASGSDDGPPGMRPEYSNRYYAAFIRDPDGNRIEVVHFLPEA